MDQLNNEIHKNLYSTKIYSSVVYVHNQYCTFISLGMEERKRGGDES